MNNLEPFWRISQDGKPSLSILGFRRFLEGSGFFKNRPNENSTFNLIKKDGIFLEIKDETDIKDYVLDYVLDSEDNESVYNLMAGKTTTFKRDFLSQIVSKEIKVLKDTKDIAYLFYNNGILEINKEGQQLKNYSDYGLSIWKKQVINRDYIDADHHTSEFRKFIWKISGESVDRYNTFQSIIGYLIHSYKSKVNNKAIILNDEIISDEPNGRSGKGLLCEAINQLKNVNSLDGKKFSFQDQFPYQSVKTDCQVLVFDDVKPHFQFINLFSIITEGMEITYKGQNTIKLPIEDSPKIVITTNHIIKGNGGSHDARKFEVELSSFFNANHTPIDFFGHRLFDDWDSLEWARFDCYMIECVKKYLNNGLISYQSINLPFKKFEVEISKELFEVLKDLKFDEWIVFEDFYNVYCNNVSKKWDAQKKNAVTRNLKKYCNFFNYTYDEVISNNIKKFKIVKTKVDPKTLDIWDKIQEDAGIN
jgi:hypothetical protein